MIAPCVGGAFGPKIMMFLAEEFLVPWGAMQLNRPVKWIEEVLELALQHMPEPLPDTAKESAETAELIEKKDGDDKAVHTH